MTFKRLLAIALIVLCTAVAWFILAGAIRFRSGESDARLSSEVVRNWGPVLTQEHPALFYEAPSSGRARRAIQPERSDVRVHLSYEPKQKGLLWYRTYFVDFEAEYLVKNPTPIAQTIYVAFRFPAADARGVKIALSVNAQPSVRGESFLLEMAVGNLLQNAIEFAPAGSTIQMRVTGTASSAEVIVEDEGPGIPDYALPRVFERFYSLQRPDTGRKSSGLGLCLVREAVELHGGTVTVENRGERSGLRAVFRLPFG